MHMVLINFIDNIGKSFLKFIFLKSPIHFIFKKNFFPNIYFITTSVLMKIIDVNK